MGRRVVCTALLNQVASVTLSEPIEYTRSDKHTGGRQMPACSRALE